MTAHFEAKRADGRPIWRVIFDYLTHRINAGELKPGDIVAHNDMRKLLTKKELNGYYSYVSRAAKELRKELKRSVIVKRGEGYQFIAGVAQAEQGKGFSKRARRNLIKGKEILQWTDRAVMSPEDRSWADRVEGGMIALAMIAQQHDEKLMRLAEQMKELKEHQTKSKARETATAEELAELRRRMDEYEQHKHPQN